MEPTSVTFHPDAIAEARGAREWYAARNESAAVAFMSELDHAVAQIAEFPNRWPTHLQGTRRYLLRRFPFALVYRESEAGLQVIAVAHGKRKPGYWKAR